MLSKNETWYELNHNRSLWTRSLDDLKSGVSFTMSVNWSESGCKWQSNIIYPHAVLGGGHFLTSAELVQTYITVNKD